MKKGLGRGLVVAIVNGIPMLPLPADVFNKNTCSNLKPDILSQK
jgi:hypothetical protein